jgi:GTP cyclohydrolase II
MCADQAIRISALFGTKGQIDVSRALADFQSRRPVLVSAGGESLLTMPVDGLNAGRLAEFVKLCKPTALRLVITGQRARALGLDATAPVALNLTADQDAGAIIALVGGCNIKCAFGNAHKPAGLAAVASINLAKLSRSLPAVLAADVVAEGVIAAEGRITAVEAEAIARFGDDVVQSLAIASEAMVPISSGKRARFVVFQDAMGSSSVAIIIGKPDLSEPVPVRIHSACLTGDVFGSRRCDCGDQLRLALARFEKLNGGIILYLAQEGRGLGLANKMRTYQMQDGGLDTFDANTNLGFDHDERDYRIAARMLQMINCRRVVLFTNNPAKLDGLSKGRIEVVSRMPLEAPVNVDNFRYLAAKASRAGHRLDRLMAFLADPSDEDLPCTINNHIFGPEAVHGPLVARSFVGEGE